MLTIEDFLNVINNDDFIDNSFLDAKSKKIRLKTLQLNTKNEPLLCEEKRICFEPVVHHDVVELYHKQEAAFWTAKEIDLYDDAFDFKKLDSNTQHFIKNILAFFASADGTVMMNLIDNFINEINSLEIIICYQFQVLMEGIHSQVYSLLIDTIIQDNEEKQLLYDAVNTVPCIIEKNAWAQKWAYSGAPFVQRLIANAIVEGIYFSGSFCAIFWIRTKNIMPGLCQSNELISRDEGMHCEFAYLLYGKLIHKMSDEDIKEMIDDAVEIEIKFINESLRCDLIGMNTKLMAQYIKYVADVLLINLGHTPLYNVTQPFGFMEHFNLQIKNNFFETKTTSYQKLKSNNSLAQIDEEF